MKNLLFISTLLFSLFSFAQECNYEDYHELVALGKKHVSRANYKEGAASFKKAFSSVDFPLGHDLSYALIAAVKTKDHTWSKEIAEQLVKGGIPINYFVKYKKTPWYNSLKANYKSYCQYYEQQFNLELKKRWLSLIQLDKEVNETMHKFREARIKLTVEEMIIISKSVSDEFRAIVENYGFPGEQELGYLYIKSKNRIENYKSNILVRHIYQRGETWYDDQIDYFICKGKLRYKDTVSKESIGFWYGIGLEAVMQECYNRYHKED